MAVSLPFTTVRCTITTDIDSTPLIVYGFDNASFIDTIWICNKNDKNIFVSFTKLVERNLEVISGQFANNIPFAPYESKEVLKGAVTYMQPGDLMYAYSSYSGDRFDCDIASRELNEILD